MRRPLLWLPLVAGCATATLDEYETCEIDLAPALEDTALAVLEAAPGDVVVVYGGPFTEVRDTRVQVGGVQATVVAVDRTDCEDCDDCRSDAGCGPCGFCDGAALTENRRATCFGDPLADEPVVGACAMCVESVSFEVPALPPGPTTVWLVNRNGTSETMAITVLPAPGATGDTGTGTATSPADTSDTGGGT